MLSFSATLDGDKVILRGLQGLSNNLPAAIGRGLNQVAKGTHRAAFDWLSGAGRSSMRMIQRNKTLKDLSRRNLRGQTDSLGARPGGYPVPVITGNLRRLLDWVKPGQSKSSGGQSFTAGPMEVVVYDSAEYAGSIHEGRSSSAKFGPRPFLTDGFDRFNHGGRVANILEEEIEAEIHKEGL